MKELIFRSDVVSKTLHYISTADCALLTLDAILSLLSRFVPAQARRFLILTLMMSFSATKLDEAKRLKREYEQRRDAGMLAAMDYSFAEWADFWFEHHKSQMCISIIV